MKQRKEKFNSSMFESIVNNMKAIHKAKNHDYAGENYLSDLTASNRMGVEAWVNVSLRLQQKMSRLENFVKQRKLEVKDEGIEDTLKDLAVYSVLALILYRNKK